MATIFDFYVAKVNTVAVANFKRLKKTADQTSFSSKNGILIDYNKLYVTYLILFDG